MSDERHSDVLGSLPHTRPQRRSPKRPPAPGAAATPPAEPAPGAAATPATEPAPGAAATPHTEPVPEVLATAPAPKARATGPAPTPRASRRAPKARAARTDPGIAPEPAKSGRSRSGGAEVLGTAVQATAELAEIGLSMSARALRGALSRLPRP